MMYGDAVELEEKEYTLTLAKDLPLEALNELSTILNPILNGKDFKALAGKMNKSFQFLRTIEDKSDPTALLLQHWWSDEGSRTVEDLIGLLKKMGRFDAVRMLEIHTHTMRPRVRPVSTVSSRSNHHNDMSDVRSYRSSDDALNRYDAPPPMYCGAMHSGASSTHSFTGGGAPFAGLAYPGSPDSDEELNQLIEEDQRLLSKMGISGPSENVDVSTHPVYEFGEYRLPQLSHNDYEDLPVKRAEYTQLRRPSYESSTPLPPSTPAANPLRGDTPPTRTGDPVIRPSCWTNGHSPNQYQQYQPDIIPSPTVDTLIATEKLALLIGNQSYRNHNRLFYPHRDVHSFSEALRRMGFTVLSLVDLNLKEMRTVMLTFCQFLGPGVFAVFYFAGHGFERNGSNYLLPIDVSHHPDDAELIAAQEILSEMQLRETALNLCIIDACRTEGISDSPRRCENRRKPGGNTIVVYSCQASTQAYEITGSHNGVYMTELLKHITTDDRIENILMKVTTAVEKNNPFIKQRPVFESDAAEDCRLTCPVQPNNKLKQCCIKWKAASIPPDPQRFDREDYKVSIKYEYIAVFSNTLRINVYMDNYSEKHVYIKDIQLLNGAQLFTEHHDGESLWVPSSRTGGWTHIQSCVLHDLQQVEEDLLLVLQMTCSFYETESHYTTGAIELKMSAGFPLIAAHFHDFTKWTSFTKSTPV